MAIRVTPDSAQDPVPAGFPPGLGALGLRGLILAVQLFFLLLAVDKSPVFGGGWGNYYPYFQVYVIIFLVAVVIEGIFRPIGHNGNRIRVALPDEDRPHAVTNFAFWFGAFFLASLGIGTALLTYLHVAAAPVQGQVRINLLVFTLVFVAPTEEFLFRSVLPRRIGWIGGSIGAFAAYHVGAYTAATGTFNNGTLISLGMAATIGGLLWFVYYDFTNKRPREGAMGRTTALHGAYDLFVYGVFGGFHLTAFALLPLVH